MKRLMFILVATFGLSSIVFAGGRYTSLGKEKVPKWEKTVKHECEFTKKSDDFTLVYIVPEPVAIEDVKLPMIEHSNSKPVKQFDLVTNPIFNKHLRLIRRL